MCSFKSSVDIVLSVCYFFQPLRKPFLGKPIATSVCGFQCSPRFSKLNVVALVPCWCASSTCFCKHLSVSRVIKTLNYTKSKRFIPEAIYFDPNV